MRRYVLLIALVFVFAACKNSPEERAKKLITADLKTSLHDFKSYEPVSFSGLTDAYSSVDFDSDAPDLLAANKELKKQYDKAYAYEREMTALEADRKEIIAARAQSDSLMNLRKANNEAVKKILDNFKSEKIGLQMVHKFRAKTLAGNLKLSDRTYIFDSSVTKIIRSYETD